MSKTRRKCHYCDKTDAQFRAEGNDDPLRPYGPGGADVCFKCATATPEREEAAGQAFGALLDGVEAVSSGPVMIGTDEGPIPFDSRRALDGDS